MAKPEGIEDRNTEQLVENTKGRIIQMMKERGIPVDPEYPNYLKEAGYIASYAVGASKFPIFAGLIIFCLAGKFHLLEIREKPADGWVRVTSEPTNWFGQKASVKPQNHLRRTLGIGHIPIEAHIIKGRNLEDVVMERDKDAIYIGYLGPIH